jgi:hypothetical protein
MIDLINTSYVSILNKIEESDKDMVNFVKRQMGKFSKGIISFGKELKDTGSDIGCVADVIDGETDIRIFIEQNKSENKGLAKEKFQGYNDEPEVGTEGSTKKVDLSVSEMPI